MFKRLCGDRFGDLWFQAEDTSLSLNHLVTENLYMFTTSFSWPHMEAMYGNYADLPDVRHRQTLMLHG